MKDAGKLEGRKEWHAKPPDLLHGSSGSLPVAQCQTSFPVSIYHCCLILPYQGESREWGRYLNATFACSGIDYFPSIFEFITTNWRVNCRKECRRKISPAETTKKTCLSRRRRIIDSEMKTPRGTLADEQCNRLSFWMRLHGGFCARDKMYRKCRQRPLRHLATEVKPGPLWCTSLLESLIPHSTFVPLYLPSYHGWWNPDTLWNELLFWVLLWGWQRGPRVSRLQWCQDDACNPAVAELPGSATVATHSTSSGIIRVSKQIALQWRKAASIENIPLFLLVAAGGSARLFLRTKHLQAILKERKHTIKDKSWSNETAGKTTLSPLSSAFCRTLNQLFTFHCTCIIPQVPDKRKKPSSRALVRALQTLQVFLPLKSKTKVKKPFGDFPIRYLVFPHTSPGLYVHSLYACKSPHFRKSVVSRAWLCMDEENSESDTLRSWPFSTQEWHRNGIFVHYFIRHVNLFSVFFSFKTSNCINALSLFLLADEKQASTKFSHISLSF